MSVPCSVVTEVGRLRENVRGHITVRVDAIDLASVEIVTQTHVETLVLSGEHLSELIAELARVSRKAKRARLRTVRSA